MEEVRTESIGMKDWQDRGWTLKSVSIPAFGAWDHENAVDLADALETKHKYESCGANSFLRRPGTRRKLRENIRERLKKKKGDSRRGAVTPAPRYDEVFLDGLEWLDELAGGAVDPGRR